MHYLMGNRKGILFPILQMSEGRPGEGKKRGQLELTLAPSTRLTGHQAMNERRLLVLRAFPRPMLPPEKIWQILTWCWPQS